MQNPHQMKIGKLLANNPDLLKQFNNWVIPSFKSEIGEYQRTAKDLQQHAKNYPFVRNLNPKVMIMMHQRGKKVLMSQITHEVENTDYYEISNIQQVLQKGKEYGRDIQRIIQGYKTNSSMPMPIVMKLDNDWFTLIGGNSRLMVAKAMGINPMVWLVALPHK
jgi:hypothetical protein